MANFIGTSRLYQWMVRYWPLTFMIMVVAFIGFGWLSLRLVEMTMANFSFINKYGWTAVHEGGLVQLAQLLLQAVCAVLFYVLFKACESALVQRLFSSSE